MLLVINPWQILGPGMCQDNSLVSNTFSKPEITKQLKPDPYPTQDESGPGHSYRVACCQHTAGGPW